MKILKNTIIVSSYVLLVALFFSGGYAIGKIGTDKNETPIPTPYEKTVEAVSEKAVQSPTYEVVIEEGKLIIYKCIGEIKTMIASEEISEDVYPKEDVEELKKGVEFERLEGAQQMFENFVS